MHSIRRIFLSAVVFAFLAVSLVARAQGPLRFVPVSPCRIVDTRWSNGPFGGPAIQGQSSRNFAIPNGSCNIPNTAAAFSLNVSVVPRGALGYLTVWPTGQPRPALFSTLNSLDGRIKANAAFAPAGDNESISIYTTTTTDVFLDINGYFVPIATDNSALAFYALTPCRLVDTRNPVGALGGPYLAGGQNRDLPILSSPCAQGVIPPTVEAYSLNVTVVPRNGAALGYLTVWPAGQDKPLVSTLNALTGTIVANAAIVPAGTGGDIDVYPTTNTDLVIDINGYFAPPESGSDALSLYTVTPCRVLDTRTTTGAFSGTLRVDVVDSPCGLPSGQAYVVNATAVPQGPLGYLTTWPDGQSKPLAATLNAMDGVITSNLAIVPTQNGWVDAYSSGTTQLVLDSVSYFASPGPLDITTTSLPAGALNVAYSATLTANGGVPPYTWSLIGGSLPPGLNLNPNGVISGLPTATGSYSFTVQVVDSNVPVQATANAQLGITIGQYLPLSITTTSLPSGTAGTAYNATVAAAGGVTPYTWTVTAGKLPTGLSLNSSTGAITGMPTVVGTSNFTVQVTDSDSPPGSASAQLSIVIKSPGGGGDPGLLKGNYAFFLNGFNFETGAWTLAGSFIADGAGNITSGVVDANSVAGQPFNTTVSGTYSIASSGLNTLTLQSQVWGPVTLAFVLNSTGSGRIIEYDDTTGQGNRGSGVLRKADSSAFSLTKLGGGYVFGMTGADNSALRMVDAGVFTLASGSITNGACDINDAGSYFTCTFAGSVTAIDAQTGRGVSTIQSSNGTSHQAVYVVSVGEFVMEQIDSVPDTHTPLLVGSVLQQSGSFSNASLNGLSVLYYQDIHAAEGADQSGAMIINSNGDGTGNVVAADEDLAGTITQRSPGPTPYTVTANGAVNFGAGNPAGFLVAQNVGLFVGSGSNSIFGTIEPQTGGPFSNASIQGAYAGGSLAPLDYPNGRNEVMTGPADGLGTFTVNGDSSGSYGLDQYFGTIVTYSMAADGRGTAETQGDATPSVIYMISPTKWIVMMTDPDARVDVFQH